MLQNKIIIGKKVLYIESSVSCLKYESLQDNGFPFPVPVSGVNCNINYFSNNRIYISKSNPGYSSGALAKVHFIYKYSNKFRYSMLLICWLQVGTIQFLVCLMISNIKGNPIWTTKFQLCAICVLWTWKFELSQLVSTHQLRLMSIMS